MRQVQQKADVLRNTAAASILSAVLASLYVFSAHEPNPQATDSVIATIDEPAVAALLRTSLSGTVEFDAGFKNIASGLCFDLYEFKPENGLPINQWSCADSANQRIWLDSVVTSDAYRLRLEHSGKCLEPSSNEVGAEVRQWVCHSGDQARPEISATAQHWNLNGLGQGRYSLVHVDSGLAITSSGAGAVNGDPLSMAQPVGDETQQFELLNRNDHKTNPELMGSWGELIAWPHVPVHAAITRDNNVLTWASNEVNYYPQDAVDKFSWSSVYSPESNAFIASNNPSHDMFCAGTGLLEDGTVMASGGNPRAAETSLFDFKSNTWVPSGYMNQARWYGTNVVTGSGDVFTSFAKGAQETAELYVSDTRSWHDVPGADMSGLRDEQDLGNSLPTGNFSAELQWYSFLHTSPDGRVIQTGPTKNMNWFDTKGQGGIQSAGTRNGDNRYRQFGSAVMYDVGKLLLTGGSDPTVANEFGSDNRNNTMGSTQTAMSIDINSASPLIEAVAPMNDRRSNHNAVVLPNGEVYVVGGTAWGLLFDDRYAAWWPEIWNPDTREWRTVAALSTPRVYHSWALLMQDGRVLTGGGGLCGSCSSNHPDAQIYSPPYLFSGDGELAPRPQILTGTTQSKVGGTLSFDTDKPVKKFNMVRLSSVTHSINNDQRFIPLDTQLIGENHYVAQLGSNVNVYIPGMYWVFAIDSDGVPSEGHLLQVQSTDVMQKSALLDVVPETGLKIIVNEPFELQLPSEDFDTDNLLFSAINLPEGLSLDQHTGEISGKLDSPIEGSFIVSYSDGKLQTTERVQYKAEEEEEGVITVSAGAIFWLPLLLLAGLGFRRQN